MGEKKKRSWVKIAAAAAACLIVAAVLTVIIMSPFIEKKIVEKLNAGLANSPGKTLTVEQVKLGVLGLYLLNVKYVDATSGMWVKAGTIMVGPWWKLPFSFSAKMTGGLVVVDDLEKALAPSGERTKVKGTLEIENIGMEIGIRGERMFFGGSSGGITFSGEGVSTGKLHVERVNGDKAGLFLSYASTGTNRVGLKMDLALFRKMLPENVKLTGNVRFIGNLRVAPLEGRGRLEVQSASFDLWGLTGTNIGGNLQTEIGEEGWSMTAGFAEGRLKTMLAEYDFAKNAAVLDAKVVSKKDAYEITGKFAAPQGVSTNWSGTVTKTAEANLPVWVDVGITIQGFPLGPLIKSDTLTVQSDGVVSRSYHLTGQWPELETTAETTVKDLGITFRSANLTLEGVETEPLKGDWQTFRQ